MKLDQYGQFVNLRTGKGAGVWATKVKGRWQYRMGPLKGDALLASGMEPAAFVKSFWYRDDFEGGNE